MTYKIYKITYGNGKERYGVFLQIGGYSERLIGLYDSSEEALRQAKILDGERVASVEQVYLEEKS